MLFTASISVLGPTQPSIHWEAVVFSLVVKRPGGPGSSVGIATELPG